MDLGIKSKQALVLASSRGLGHGVAIALAREGANVLLCGRSADDLAQNCAQINSEGEGHADWFQADLSEERFVSVAAGAVAQRGKPIDILVNNTGGPTSGSAEAMTAEQLQLFFMSMVVRVIDLTNRLLPDMKKKGWGRVLTLASSGVIEPINSLALSNTLRPALVGWSKTLATEVADQGITSNVLLPGAILTARINQLNEAAAKRTGKPVEDVRANSEKQIPVGRYGRVDEFASVAAFLCSNQASYITGSIVRCDGGATRSI